MTEFDSFDFLDDPIVKQASEDEHVIRTCSWLAACGLADYERITDIYFPMLESYLLEKFGIVGEHLPAQVYDRYLLSHKYEEQL